MNTKYYNAICKRTVVLSMLVLILMTSSDAFCQNLTGVNPDEGIQGQTLQLTISGQSTNFLQATNAVSLRQGTSTIIYPIETGNVSNLELVATFGLSFGYDPGHYDMRVYNEIDGEMVLENAFEIIENPEQPSLTGVEPNQAEIGQILNLTISGQFTHFQASSTTVWLQQGTHTIYPGYTVMNSNTQATAHFSFNQYHSTGVYDVKTFNAIDGPLTLYNSFNLLPGNLPAIAAIEPTSGTIGELLGFDIYGENTHFDEASVVLAYLENSNNQIIELLFDNQFQIWTNEQIEGAIIIPFDASPGMYNLHVFDNIDGSMVLPQAFYVNPNSESPEIFSIDPDSCYANQQVDVQVQTLNTWYTWSNELYVSMKKNNSNERIWAESIDIENNQELLAHFNIPYYSPGGYWDFIVTDNICGELVLEGGMVIIDTITGIDRNIIASTLQIFPNPATETFKVSTPSRLENCKVTIYNLTGQRKEYNQVNFSPNQAVQFDIQNLTRGFYFVQIITNEEIIIKKIIKQ